VEPSNGGFSLCTDASKQMMVRRFLFDAYPLVKETVARNNTERLREEREKRVKTKELDRLALEKLSDGIICVDPNGSLYFMNPAAEDMLTDNPELRERLFGPGSFDETLKKYSADAVVSRVTGSSAPGSVEVFGDRVSVIIDEKRFQVQLGDHIIILRDITDQHLVDMEIGKLYRHELKAALDVMGIGIENARQLSALGSTGEVEQCLDLLEQKRCELFSMLEERMDFIRLHSDSFKVRKDLVNLNLAADKCLANYREAASSRNIEVKSDHLHVGVVNVAGEERFLIKALDNILRNAVKFSDHGSEINLSVGTNASKAFIKVEDSGPGIPAENMSKIFQLGFTTNGSGRGLYLARRIVAAHHGNIEVRNKPGGGACFTIKLPLWTE
jgi:signal transduction histidine kinase